MNRRPDEGHWLFILENIIIEQLGSTVTGNDKEIFREESAFKEEPAINAQINPEGNITRNKLEFHKIKSTGHFENYNYWKPRFSTG